MLPRVHGRQALHALAHDRLDGSEYPESLGLLLSMRDRLHRLARQDEDEEEAGSREALERLVPHTLALVLKSYGHFDDGEVCVSLVSADGRTSNIERKSENLRSAQSFARRAER